MNMQKIILGFLLLGSVVESCAKTCPPNTRLTCIDIKEQLDAIQTLQVNCCAALNLRLDQIDGFVSSFTCEKSIIFIDQTFMNAAPPQITQEGVYCLVESVVGDLVIDADNVTINMNNFAISNGTNLISSTGHTDITINGFGALRNATANGVLFTTCTGIKVSDINFENCETALECSAVNMFKVDHCSVVGSTTQGMRFITSTNGKVTCCQLHDNSLTNCITCDTAENILFSDIKVENNTCNIGYQNISVANVAYANASFNNNNTINGQTLHGWRFNQSQDSKCQNCYACRNGLMSIVGPSFMFLSDTSNKIIFDACNACNNNINNAAISINDSTNCCVLNCLSKENLLNGIQVLNSANSYVHKNTAVANASNGFFWDGINNNSFLSNYANANGTNYAGVPSIIRFDTSVGEFRDPLNACVAVSPSDWNNIAIEVCP